MGVCMCVSGGGDSCTQTHAYKHTHTHTLFVQMRPFSELKDGKNRHHHETHNGRKEREVGGKKGREKSEGEEDKERATHTHTRETGCSVRAVTSVWLVVSRCIVPGAGGDSLSSRVIDN